MTVFTLWCCHHDIVIARVHPVHLMNADDSYVLIRTVKVSVTFIFLHFSFQTYVKRVEFKVRVRIRVTVRFRVKGYC